LIKDERPTTLKPVSTSTSSQSVRDTHNKTVDEVDKKADLNETMAIERLLSMNNASNQDNQTDSIIKLLKRQAPPNPPQMVVPPQTGQPPQQQFFQQQQPIPQQFFQQQQQPFPLQQQQQFIQQPLQQPILVNQMPRAQGPAVVLPATPTSPAFLLQQAPLIDPLTGQQRFFTEQVRFVLQPNSAQPPVMGQQQPRP